MPTAFNKKTSFFLKAEKRPEFRVFFLKFKCCQTGHEHRVILSEVESDRQVTWIQVWHYTKAVWLLSSRASESNLRANARPDERDVVIQLIKKVQPAADTLLTWILTLRPTITLFPPKNFCKKFSGPGRWLSIVLAQDDKTHCVLCHHLFFYQPLASRAFANITKNSIA